MKTTELSERKNSVSNQWEFHRDGTRHGHDSKNKEYKKTQKQINEIIGALNKYQSETENTINRELN
jgi:hypothetical protein